MSGPPALAGLWPVLERVSRSFYLSLRLLPRCSRETLGLAYLLARAADTVADTEVVPRSDRLRLLLALGEAYGPPPPPSPPGAGPAAPARARPDAAALAELARLAEREGVPPGDRALLRELPRCLELLAALPALEARLVAGTLGTIVQGMHDDLSRFPGGGPDQLAALETRGDLLRYCYQVAGCVGELWSDLHVARLATLRRVDPDALRGLGARFGRALQLTNVLRDVAEDLRHGRCYLPRQDLLAHGLVPRDLLRPDAWPRLRPLHDDLLAQARADAEAGLEYTLRLPPREVALRLAGLLPLLLALMTLGRVARGNPLDPGLRIKVPRLSVYVALARAFRACRDDRAVAALFRETLRAAGLPRRASPGP